MKKKKIPSFVSEVNEREFWARATRLRISIGSGGKEWRSLRSSLRSGQSHSVCQSCYSTSLSFWRTSETYHISPCSKCFWLSELNGN